MRKMASQSILHIVGVCINRIGTVLGYFANGTLGLSLSGSKGHHGSIWSEFVRRAVYSAMSSPGGTAGAVRC